MNCRRSKRRSGFTLLETLVLMATMSVCLFVGTMLIVSAMKTDRVGETAANRIAWRHELARTFRDDVHQAQSAGTLWDLQAGGVLTLRKPGGVTIDYECDKNALVRTERRGTKETKRLLPAGSKETALEFVPGATDPRIITLRITEREGKGRPRQSDLTAAIGRDLR